MPEFVFDDPATQNFIRKGAQRLQEEFRGIFVAADHSALRGRSHRLARRRARQGLRADVCESIRPRTPASDAQAQGSIVKEVPEVLFVCVHNAGRSQMAAGLLDLHANGRVHVRSAGSTPADEINPAAIAAMAELGIDLREEFPKPLTDEFVNAADVVITMGCGDACPIYPGKRYEDWEVDDPAGRSLAEVRGIRDDIDRRMRLLLASLVPTEVGA